MAVNLMCERCGVCFLDDSIGDIMTLSFVCESCRSGGSSIFRTRDILKSI